MGANHIILRRTHPSLPYLPLNDPPKGSYDAVSMARFVRDYQTVARGFYDAIRIQSLHREIWLCPNCDKSNTFKRISETGNNYCKWCGSGCTYNQILIGPFNPLILSSPPEPDPVNTRQKPRLQRKSKPRPPMTDVTLLEELIKCSLLPLRTLTSIANRHKISVEKLRRVVANKCFELGLGEREARMRSTASLIRYLKAAKRDDY